MVAAHSADDSHTLEGVSPPVWTFPAAIATVIAATTVLYFLVTPIATAIGLREVAVAVVAMPLTATAWVHRGIKTRWYKKNREAVPELVKPPADFLVPWYQIAVYAGFALVAFLEVGSFVGAFVFALLTSDATLGQFAGLGSGFVLPIAGAFLLGRWIGVRGRNRRFMAAMAAALVGALASLIVDWVTIQVWQPAGVQVVPLLDLVLIRAGLHLAPWALAALTGVWMVRGRSRVAYLAFLASELEEADQARLVNFGVEVAAARAANREEMLAAPPEEQTPLRDS